MIEVRVRHEDEAKGRRLMDWRADDLDSVIPLLSAWSIYTPEHGDVVEFSGQFVLDGTSAYFEVVLHEED